MPPLHWPFYAALAIAYLYLVGILVREVWSGLRHGRTGFYWRGTLLKARRVEYLQAETPWKFRAALATNGLLLVGALVLGALIVGGGWFFPR